MGERPLIVVRFEPAAIELTGSPGERLLDLTDELQSAVLPSACRAANCGTCLLHVLQGWEVLEPASPRETATLRDLGAEGSARLGCQIELARTRVLAGARVVLRLP